MIGAVGPAHDSVEQTLNTLRYASTVHDLSAPPAELRASLPSGTLSSRSLTSSNSASALYPSGISARAPHGPRASLPAGIGISAQLPFTPAVSSSMPSSPTPKRANLPNNYSPTARRYGVSSAHSSPIAARPPRNTRPLAGVAASPPSRYAYSTAAPTASSTSADSASSPRPQRPPYPDAPDVSRHNSTSSTDVSTYNTSMDAPPGMGDAPRLPSGIVERSRDASMEAPLSHTVPQPPPRRPSSSHSAHARAPLPSPRISLAPPPSLDKENVPGFPGAFSASSGIITILV